MDNSALVFTAYVATNSELIAEQAMQSMLSILRPYGQVVHFRIEPYWKIDGYFEIFLELSVPSSAVFRNVLLALGTGWESHCYSDGNDWAVWNPDFAFSFCREEVRWAHLELISEDKNSK